MVELFEYGKGYEQLYTGEVCVYDKHPTRPIYYLNMDKEPAYCKVEHNFFCCFCNKPIEKALGGWTGEGESDNFWHISCYYKDMKRRGLP